VVCPVLKLREEKWTFVIVGGGKIDFFLLSYGRTVVGPKARTRAQLHYRQTNSGASVPALSFARSHTHIYHMYIYIQKKY
jgi:hypothetical protein